MQLKKILVVVYIRGLFGGVMCGVDTLLMGLGNAHSAGVQCHVEQRSEIIGTITHCWALGMQVAIGIEFATLFLGEAQS